MQVRLQHYGELNHVVIGYVIYFQAKARNPLLKPGTFLNPLKSNAPTRTERRQKKKPGADGKPKKKTRKFGRGGMRRR